MPKKFVSGLNNVGRKDLMKVISREFPALLCFATT
jgi:hypothetical protein